MVAVGTRGNNKGMIGLLSCSRRSKDPNFLCEIGSLARGHNVSNEQMGRLISQLLKHS
jgi:Lon protease-like protein